MMLSANRGYICQFCWTIEAVGSYVMELNVIDINGMIIDEASQAALFGVRRDDVLLFSFGYLSLIHRTSRPLILSARPRLLL